MTKKLYSFRDLKGRITEAIENACNPKISKGTSYDLLGESHIQFTPGELILVSAQPNYDANRLVAHLFNKLLPEDPGILVLSLDKTEIHCGTQFAAAGSKIDMGRIVDGYLGKGEYREISTYLEKTGCKNIMISGGPAGGVKEVNKIISDTEETFRVGVLIIDSVNLMSYPGQITDTLEQLKETAVKKNLVVIAALALEGESDAVPGQVSKAAGGEVCADKIICLNHDDRETRGNCYITLSCYESPFNISRTLTYETRGFSLEKKKLNPLDYNEGF